ncbi:hypothetical protein BHM03_00037400, partial [Ensete ventricosum]
RQAAAGNPLFLDLSSFPSLVVAVWRSGFGSSRLRSDSGGYAISRAPIGESREVVASTGCFQAIWRWWIWNPRCIGNKLSDDSRKYGVENTCTSGNTLSKAALCYARARAQMENERGNLLKALGTQVL